MPADRHRVSARRQSPQHSVTTRRAGPSRLLPIAIMVLGVTTILKSATLMESAFAQQSPSTASGDTQPAGVASANVNAPPEKKYWPVSNWTDRPPPPPMCKPDPLTETGETATLLTLKARAAMLDRRALALEHEQQELDATKAALRQQIAAMKPLAARLEGLKAERQAADSNKWSALVETYGAMEPRSAARIFDGLQSGIVFNVLRRMNNRKSAAILASMSPDKAQIITERLAGESPPPAIQPANSLLPDAAP